MGFMLGMEAPLNDDGGVLDEVGRVFTFEDRLLQIEVGDGLVDLDGIGHHRFGEGEVVRQDLQVLLHLLGRSPGLFLGLGGHQGHHVAAAADLLAGDDRELPDAGALLPSDVTLHGHVVGALDVLGGHDLDDARHLLGL